ncbi:MAG TPA: TIM barrel protein [Terriglobia bacterium]|nr:TIM barrel protein [Terriglobia bacterium]
MTRREHLKRLGFGAAGLAGLSWASGGARAAGQPFLKIAMGEYSLNHTLRAGKYNPLHLAQMTRKVFGLDAIDYVSTFWAEKAKDPAFVGQLKSRAEEYGVLNHVILVDMRNLELGDLDESRRKQAVEAHRRWIDIAEFLGCSSIRVNLNRIGAEDYGKPGHKEAVFKASVDGYRRLLAYGAQKNIGITVQNHIGYSCDPDWLVAVMKAVNSKYAGIQADPDHFEEHFYVKKSDEGYEARKGASFDKYKGLAKLMPYTKALNAKTHAFDREGNETTLDYDRILRIVLKSGYRGYIGIEWEPEGPGLEMSDVQGIQATKDMLVKKMAELA